jgi:predicted TIM-barrel fold metal-dependent hydrolase
MYEKSRLDQFEVIDFHVHVYPRIPWPAPVSPLRQKIHDLVRPLSRLQQEAQTWLRLLPSKIRSVTDEFGIPMVMPHLLVESDIFDLQQEMAKERVSKAVVVPHPPLISNDFVFYESKRIDGLIPAAFIDPATIKTPADLAAFYNRGIRLFKVNPLQSGVPVEATYYLDFLSYLNSKKAVLMIHTGALSSHLFKLPKAGDIEEYRSWFQNYPDIRFVAAHMNFHEPEKAIKMASQFNNLYLLSSWQPAKVLKKAIHQLGPERILFASDWPLLGENIRIQKERIWSLYEAGELNEEDLRLIFSENALRLLSEPVADSKA